MSESKKPHKIDKIDENNQFSGSGIFIKEDDQDWGSSGMNDIQLESSD